jgi:hypothetical protein
MSTGGGKSHGSSSSIYIGSTESAKQKVGTLVIGKNDLAIDLPLKPLTLKPETIKPTRWRLLPIEQALTVEQTNMPPKPLLLRLPI